MDYRAKAICEALQDKMINGDFTSKQVSASTGIAETRIDDLYNGKESMTAQELYSFCEFFHCKFEDFFIGLYDCSTIYSGDFPRTITPEFREKYLLKYFRLIKVTNAQDHLCGLVRAVATNSTMLDNPCGFVEDD